MTIFRTLAIGAAVLAAPFAANAAPITGNIGFTGLFQGENAAGQNVRLRDAVAIDFCADATATTCTGSAGPGGTGELLVNFVSADSTFGVAVDQRGTIQDFTFSPFSGPIVNFFQVGEVSFDLESLGVDAQFTSTAAGGRQTDFLNVSGLGVLRRAGFDATPGTFTFSGQSNGRDLLGTFTFSGGSAALPVAVPAPAGLALLGAGLLGLGLVRRRNAA